MSRPSPPPESFKRLVALQWIALLGVGALTVLSDWCEKYHAVDLMYYDTAAALFLHGEMPYRDFPFAYPPLALLPFCLSRLATLNGDGTLRSYAWGFLFQSVLWKTALTLVLARIAAGGGFDRTARQTVTLETILVVVSAALLPWRFDLFPALLTLLAVRCALTGRAGWAGVCLGLGTAAKLYPLVLVPVFAAYFLAGRRPREIAVMLASTAATVVISLLPFLTNGPGTALAFLRLHEQRGLEIESLAAGGLLLAVKMGLTDARIAYNFYAFHLSAPLAGGILRLLPLAFALSYALTLWRGFHTFRREQQESGEVRAQSLVTFVTAALLCFILCNKVFSTQYIFWLLPFIPLLRTRPAIVLAIAYGLSSLIYPFAFVALLNTQWWALLLLNGRNLLLLGVFCALLRGGPLPTLSIPRPFLPIMRARAASGESR